MSPSTFGFGVSGAANRREIDRATGGDRTCDDKFQKIPAGFAHEVFSFEMAKRGAGRPGSSARAVRVRRRYQMRMVAMEKSQDQGGDGVDFRRDSAAQARDQISSGSVLSRPIRKKLTAISSSERVKINRPRGNQGDAQVGQRYPPEGFPVIRAEVERGFFLRAVEFLQTRENFGGGDGDQAPCRGRV